MTILGLVVEWLLLCTRLRKPMRRAVLAAALAISVAACRSTTPGAQPHDMSAAQHESAAAEHEQAAEAHAAQFNPDAFVRTQRCGRTDLTRGTGVAAPVCWTSTANPTSQHRAEADKHRQMAADHRAASLALGEAEARACAGVPDEDRDMSPFEHREDIESVEPLNEGTTTGKAQYARTVGALITFRAVPGMTAQWLQRVVDCHLARNAALGHDVPDMPDCPLVPRGASAKVSATEKGFAVAVRADDSETAQEILRRARALVGQRTSSSP